MEKHAKEEGQEMEGIKEERKEGKMEGNKEGREEEGRGEEKRILSCFVSKFQLVSREKLERHHIV